MSEPFAFAEMETIVTDGTIYFDNQQEQDERLFDLLPTK